MTQDDPRPARTKLLDAALVLIRQKGFAATSVDDLCRAAGVTKGAFFHHFATKDDLGAEAARHWGRVTGALFAAAEYHRVADPFDRIMAYLDLREALLQGEVAEFTCLAGTLLQEVHASSPAITAAAWASIRDHAETLEPMFAAAIAAHAPATPQSAESLARLTQTFLQGAFILSKGEGTSTPAREALGHLRAYLTMIFMKE
jgi:TetR/AcrR family transcriptional repressor of nem operon